MTGYLDKLKRARVCEKETSVQLEHIERLHRIMKLPQSSAENSKRLVEKLAELERQINEQIDETVDSKREALVVLSCLEGEERTVMYDYYILAKDWLKIAEELFMSDRRVFNLRKSAFEKLEKRYGNSDDKESA